MHKNATRWPCGGAREMAAMSSRLSASGGSCMIEAMPEGKQQAWLGGRGCYSTATPATAAAPNGATTTATYDPEGNKLTSTASDGTVTTLDIHAGRSWIRARSSSVGR